MSLLDRYDVILLDLDGVVYRGSRAVEHAVAALVGAHDAGVRTVFVTNNAARPPAVVSDHLGDLGIPCTADDVVTSAQVGAEMMSERLRQGDRVLAIGGPGVSEALVAQGFVPVAAEATGEGHELEVAQSVRGVLQGFGPDVSWRHLALASYAVAAGAVWIATNTDQTIPRAAGIAPGNGTLVGAVRAATGVVPPSAGKPAPDMMRIAARRTAAREPLMVGDRLDTDIAGAVAAGMDSLLVLTGVSGAVDLLTCSVAERPTYVAADLRGLCQPLTRIDQAHGPMPAEVLRPRATVVADIVSAVWRDRDCGAREIDVDSAARLLHAAVGITGDA